MTTGREWLTQQGYHAIDEKSHEKMGAHLEGDGGKGLLLIGNPGTGKTMFCHLIVGKLNTIPCRCLVETAEDTNSKRMMTELRSIATVALDDLGQEGKLYGRELMGDVIDELYSRGFGKVYITTNLDPSQIRARYGDRTVSRILSMTVTIRINAPDQRIVDRCLP